MPAEFPPVTSVEAVEELFDRSHTAPVVIFKHDPYCPISMAAHSRMAAVSGDVVMVDVANDQAIASEVAKRTGVRHESPQVIVLKDGQATWSASHYSINAQAVADATAK